ncbi:MAG: family 2 glycosyl transferase [Candidatus Collierbacteria bacterium GW2011_GWA2_46_26]|uniref:Family 2 glycosyl transferase n=1 Tax=Candidatus Collierbacteria bacterium GW2011_GWA2_46_26 TaxID=1618381 RepID=A0A0G1PM56_9BACT|nr:MAG: family 2 glycosyl transferase [Candidatus Collierbacteria bacterium GW2011_GWC2_44_13]KKU33826.1 MAG: family 2 glycosyl transferase [Candidatus Collierbacteria bacterium GW2011_GWA2_46_26]
MKNSPESPNSVSGLRVDRIYIIGFVKQKTSQFFVRGSSNKLPLTIVTAVLNEEKLLPAFLGHIRDFADEVIVVVDFRTTDQSAAVAKKFGCKILFDKGESRGIVFNNKNWGASEANHGWVMVLDADERMDETLQEEVRSIVLGTHAKQADVYQTSFINYEFGKLFEKSDQKKKPFVRLFRKGAFTYQTGSTAEGFGIQAASLSSGLWYGKYLLKIPLVRSWYLNKIRGVVTLKGHLVHLSHPTIMDFIKKIDHYSTREALLLFDKNQNRPDWYFLFRMIVSPLKEFLYKYFIWQLYKEGLHGYIASVVYGFYYFLINAKYFRYTYRKKHLKEIESIGKKYDLEDL